MLYDFGELSGYIASLTAFIIFRLRLLSIQVGNPSRLLNIMPASSVAFFREEHPLQNLTTSDHLFVVRTKGQSLWLLMLNEAYTNISSVSPNQTVESSFLADGYVPSVVMFIIRLLFFGTKIYIKYDTCKFLRLIVFTLRILQYLC